MTGGRPVFWGFESGRLPSLRRRLMNQVLPHVRREFALSTHAGSDLQVGRPAGRVVVKVI